MDQLDAIIKLKNCFRELDELDKEIDENQVYKEISYTKTLIAKKMLEIAQVLNVEDFIPKSK